MGAIPMIVDETPSDRAVREGWAARLENIGYLYRYRAIHPFSRIKDIVLRSRLYFPCFRNLNDPFDGKIQLDFTSSPETIRTFWEAHLRERGLPVDHARIQAFIDGRDDPAVQAEIHTHYQHEVDKLGVVCFSEPPGDIPMWAYYADSQKGVCLRFR